MASAILPTLAATPVPVPPCISALCEVLLQARRDRQCRHRPRHSRCPSAPRRDASSSLAESGLAPAVQPAHSRLASWLRSPAAWDRQRPPLPLFPPPSRRFLQEQGIDDFTAGHHHIAGLGARRGHRVHAANRRASRNQAAALRNIGAPLRPVHSSRHAQRGCGVDDCMRPREILPLNVWQFAATGAQVKREQSAFEIGVIQIYGGRWPWIDLQYVRFVVGIENEIESVQSDQPSRAYQPTKHCCNPQTHALRQRYAADRTAVAIWRALRDAGRPLFVDTDHAHVTTVSGKQNRQGPSGLPLLEIMARPRAMARARRLHMTSARASGAFDQPTGNIGRRIQSGFGMRDTERFEHPKKVRRILDLRHRIRGIAEQGASSRQFCE